jgi:hypothetical protein
VTEGKERSTGSSRPDATKDTGLRQLMTWTLIALVFAVLFSWFAVRLVYRWFGG